MPANEKTISEKTIRTDAGLASSLRMSVARLSRRLRTERADEPEVSPSGIPVLGILHRDGSLTIGQLATSERVRPPSMTRTVACLERDGFVVREAHPTDRRQVLVTVTDEGREALLADRRRRDEWLAVKLTRLTAEERELLRRAAPILDRLSSE